MRHTVFACRARPSVPLEFSARANKPLCQGRGVTPPTPPLNGTTSRSCFQNRHPGCGKLGHPAYECDVRTRDCSSIYLVICIPLVPSNHSPGDLSSFSSRQCSPLVAPPSSAVRLRNTGSCRGFSGRMAVLRATRGMDSPRSERKGAAGAHVRVAAGLQPDPAAQRLRLLAVGPRDARIPGARLAPSTGVGSRRELRCGCTDRGVGPPAAGRHARSGSGVGDMRGCPVATQAIHAATETEKLP